MTGWVNVLVFLVVLTLAGTLFFLTGSTDLALLLAVFPPNLSMVAYAGLGALDVGAPLWGVIFVFGPRDDHMRGLAAFVSVIDMIGIGYCFFSYVSMADAGISPTHNTMLVFIVCTIIVVNVALGMVHLFVWLESLVNPTASQHRPVAVTPAPPNKNTVTPVTKASERRTIVVRPPSWLPKLSFSSQPPVQQSVVVEEERTHEDDLESTKQIQQPKPYAIFYTKEELHTAIKSAAEQLVLARANDAERKADELRSQRVNSPGGA